MEKFTDTIRSLNEKLVAGQVTSVELVEEAIRRIKAENDTINAVITFGGYRSWVGKRHRKHPSSRSHLSIFDSVPLSVSAAARWIRLQPAATLSDYSDSHGQEASLLHGRLSAWMHHISRSRRTVPSLMHSSKMQMPSFRNLAPPPRWTPHRT